MFAFGDYEKQPSCFTLIRYVPDFNIFGQENFGQIYLSRPTYIKWVTENAGKTVVNRPTLAN